MHNSSCCKIASRLALSVVSAQDKLISDGLGKWQGPAIFFYNSQPAFSSHDLDCFTRSVGDSAKAGNSQKIGQFGLGAITAYHFTDVIQLLSGPLRSWSHNLLRMHKTTVVLLTCMAS